MEEDKKFEMDIFGEQLKTKGYNRTVYRIQALRDFGDIKAGDFGGFLESENNLSHSGLCWVHEGATVLNDVQISGDLQVLKNSLVTGAGKQIGSGSLKGKIHFKTGCKLTFKSGHQR